MVFHVCFVGMIEWVKALLEADKQLSQKQRECTLITLRWYLGYCAKMELGEPGKRENGRIFWKNAVLAKQPEPWQEKQWSGPLKWFFEATEGRSRAGVGSGP